MKRSISISQRICRGDTSIWTRMSLSMWEAYTVQELCDKILSGEIEDSKTIAAVMSYRAKFGKD